VNNAALQQALQQAKQALVDRQAALKAGDWSAYGAADDRLQQALQAALAAEGGSGSGSGSGSTSTPTPTPTPKK
jgi:hypothetical protein